MNKELPKDITARNLRFPKVLKKEIHHSCPDNFVYDDKRGKCVNPNLSKKRIS